MRAFVVRSFGIKRGIDFDRVERELIRPALSKVGADGGTTAEIIEAGNIREDMFEQLVSADLVVADVSIHNANVFYELGVRHAVKDRATVLIRASIDEVPFDLQTDRYLPYDPAAPGEATERLVRTLNATLAGERSDSPIFSLLERFVPANQSALIALPRTFQEDVASATSSGGAGALRLIAEEVNGLRFEEPALRLVAAALQRVGDNHGARPVWERLRVFRVDDLQANEALANIYRRLGDGSGADDLAVASNQAISRAWSNRSMANRPSAELSALRGSLSKLRWESQWRKAPDQQDREALRSRELDAALRLYSRGFMEDLNHYYSGLNALALVEIAITLADRFPDEWRYHATSDEVADLRLKELHQDSKVLRESVGAAIEATRQRLDRDSDVDPWLGVSFAELLLLRGEDPDRVANAYATLASPVFGPSERASIRRQLEIYQDLKVHTEQVERVFQRNAALLDQTQQTPTHPIVFVGHIVDNSRLPTPWFPADKVDAAKAAIRKSLQEVLTASGADGDRLIGVAGASDGGDLLFHEVCQELEIPTEVMLPLPKRDYLATVQADHASGWAGRYHQVFRAATQVHVLSRTAQLPPWLGERPSYSPWQRQNRWMLHHAWAMPGVERVTAVALSDDDVDEAPPSGADATHSSQVRRAAVLPVNTTELFKITSPSSAQQPAEVAATVPPAEVSTTTSDDADAGLLAAWEAHQEFSAIATVLGEKLRRARLLNLSLLVAGALLGAMATLPWFPSGLARGLSGAAAVALAFAGALQLYAISKDQTESWIAARVTSEALKASVFRFLVRTAPYTGADRLELLNQTVANAREQQSALRAGHPDLVTAHRPVPRIDDFTTYVSVRAQQQADWHRTRSRDYGRKSVQLRRLQLLVTVIGMLLTAVATIQPTWLLAPWTAAATTIAATVGAYLGARQFHRLAVTFGNTAFRLNDLIATAGTAARSPDGQARFIDQVEGILAAQNGDWPATLRGQ